MSVLTATFVHDEESDPLAVVTNSAEPVESGSQAQTLESQPEMRETMVVNSNLGITNDQNVRDASFNYYSHIISPTPDDGQGSIYSDDLIFDNSDEDEDP